MRSINNIKNKSCTPPPNFLGNTVKNGVNWGWVHIPNHCSKNILQIPCTRDFCQKLEFGNIEKILCSDDLSLLIAREERSRYIKRLRKPEFHTLGASPHLG